MHSKLHFVIRVLGAVALIAAVSGPAGATVVQRVFTSFTDINGLETVDSNGIDDTAGPITDSVTAAISGDFGNVLSSIGPFGNLGMQGELFRPGEFRDQVFIRNDNIVNNTGRAQTARANFIIDGGIFSMFAGGGSNMSFLLNIRADILGDGEFATNFQTGFELQQTAGAGVSVQFFGTDIGATFNQITATVDMPVFFGSFEIGEMLPNSVIDIEYQVDITGTLIDFTEFTNWQFSDPFNVDGFGETPTVTFSDVSNAVPEPAGALLLLTGLGLLAGMRRAAVG